MSIKTYTQDDKLFYKVYLNLRSKEDKRIRVQKTVTKIDTLKEAKKIEKYLLQELSKKIAKLEGQGFTWIEVIDRWSDDALRGLVGTYQRTTVLDYKAALLKWTYNWLKKPANKIRKADAVKVIRDAEREGKSPKTLKSIKHMINVVFNYGLEEGIIRGVDRSPVYGLKVKASSEKSPDILTIKELQKFLKRAKEHDHPWYPIWLTACLTGMRNGELYALKWEDLVIDWDSEKDGKDFIRVSRSYNKRTREMKSTKAGYWRNVPISYELKSLFRELKENPRNSEKYQEFILPRIREWSMGYQAKVLKVYLRSIGIKPIKFHALRACFATSLLTKGLSAPVVMKICGWRDLGTMDYYVRLAGVEELEAIECLNHLGIAPKQSILEASRKEYALKN